MESQTEVTDSGGFISDLISELTGNPVNIVLLGVCGYLLYRVLKSGQQDDRPIIREQELPSLPKKDMTVDELKQYDGKQLDGRILMAVNGKVFDVTRGKKFYGPDGPYGIFAGKDASRGLATFSLSQDALKDGYDDLSDLSPMEMDSVREWEMQFQMKYDYIGRLLPSGETKTEPGDVEQPSNKAENPLVDSENQSNETEKPLVDVEEE